MTKSLTDRIKGALLGAFVGDALALGPHWYYNLDEQRRDFGDWIDDYTTPRPDRYHGGMKAGQLSQAGIILKMLLTSLTEKGKYVEEDFCRHLDEELFPLLDGTPTNGPGGYTSQSIREAWQKRVQEKRPWSETAGHADDTEAIERNLSLAVRYAFQPGLLAQSITSNTLLTQNDEMVVALTVSYGATLGLLIQGEPFDAELTGKLMDEVDSGALPFHKGTGKKGAAGAGRPQAGFFSSPDALMLPGSMARAANDAGVHIEPAWKASIAYGMPCAIYFLLPSAYYLASRFNNDFEAAVLHAVNGGGQNQARANLVGALVGAQTGLSGIPRRFIEGLEEAEELLKLAEKVAKQVTAEQ